MFDWIYLNFPEHNYDNPDRKSELKESEINEILSLCDKRSFGDEATGLAL